MGVLLIKYSLPLISTLGVAFGLFYLILTTNIDIAVVMRILERKKIAIYILWALISCYAIIFSVLSIWKYHAYNMGSLDFGRMVQLAWGITHNNFFKMTFEFGNMSRFFAHTEFIFAPIGVILYFIPHPETLLVIQAVVVSLGAWAIFMLSKAVFNDSLVSLFFGLAYLCNPSVQFGNLRDFHPDMLALTFLLFAFYFLIRQKQIEYWVFIFLSLACKEYVSLITIMLGFFIFFVLKRRKTGACTFLIGAFWALMSLKVLPCLASPGRWYWSNSGIYSNLGNSPGEALAYLLSHPFEIIKYLSLNKLMHFILLLLPLGFLSFFDPLKLAIALPVFLAVILATPNLFSYTNHHNGSLLPFVFISAIYGSYAFAGVLGKGLQKNRFYAVAVFVLSCSILSAYFYGPSPLNREFRDAASYRYWKNEHNYLKTRHDAVIDYAVRLIPDGVPVSASNHIAPHLSMRKTIYYLPYPRDFSEVDFVVADILEFMPYSWLTRERQLKAVGEILKDNRFALIFSYDGVLVFKKTANQTNRFQNQVTQINHPQPKISIGKVLDDRLLLLGYDSPVELHRGQKSRFILYWKALEGYDRPFKKYYFGKEEQYTTDYIIVSTFSNAKDKNEPSFNVLHLPTILMLPVAEWKGGATFSEDFDFFLPADLKSGEYSWNICLYAMPRAYIFTEKRDIICDINIGDIEIK